MGGKKEREVRGFRGTHVSCSTEIVLRVIKGEDPLPSGGYDRHYPTVEFRRINRTTFNRQ